ISQVYGGGGNVNAQFNRDFIELFNRGSSPVNIAGWSVQYAGSNGSTWAATPLGSFNLQPGQYYLVHEATVGANGMALPTADATGTIAQAAGAGKVALVSNTTVLSGGCPVGGAIVDFIGYGTAATCS